MGAIASGLGIGIAMVVGGVLSLAVGVVALAWIRRRGVDRPVRPWAPAKASVSTMTGSLPEGARPR
jgi:hypothetical protein